MMDNFTSSTTIAGDVDDLKTPALNLVGYTSASLTFDVAYARYNATYSDTLSVMVSTDCGQTWASVYTKGGATLATQPDQTAAFNSPTTWRNESVNLSQFLGNNALYVAFRNKSGWGQKLYIDNINITGVNVTTPPTASFTSAPTGTACTGQTIQYTNTSTGSPTSYSWSFPGGTPSTSTAQNPTVSYAAAGTYNVSMTATNSFGSNTSNQTGFITVKPTPTVTSPGNTTACIGTATSAISFTGSSVSSTYSWVNNNPSIGLPSTGTGNITPFTPTAAGTANITVTPTLDGCSGAPVSFSITVSNCSADIDESTDDFLLIYPNPTSGLLTLKGETLTKYNNVNLIDAAGRVVGDWSISGTIMNLDLTAYAAGNYSLKITGENAQALKKIQIKK
jgi:PKD repeat protein